MKPTKEEIFKHNKNFLLRIRKQRIHLIGIDLGTFITGISISHKNYTDKIESSLKSITSRINIISNEINKILKPYNANAIALIEDYAFAGKTVVQEAELGGMVKNRLFVNNIPFMTIAPTTVKKFVLGEGKGHAKSRKELMLLEAYKRWAISFDDNNECDAYCIRKFLEYMFNYLDRSDKFKKWEEKMFRDFVINRGDPVM